MSAAERPTIPAMASANDLRVQLDIARWKEGQARDDFLMAIASNPEVSAASLAYSRAKRRVQELSVQLAEVDRG